MDLKAAQPQPKRLSPQSHREHRGYTETVSYHEGHEEHEGIFITAETAEIADALKREDGGGWEAHSRLMEVSMDTISRRRILALPHSTEPMCFLVCRTMTTEAASLAEPSAIR